MKKITEGRVRDRDVTWFPQLVDNSKCKYVTLHSYINYIPIKEEYQVAPILGNEKL